MEGRAKQKKGKERGGKLHGRGGERRREERRRAVESRGKVEGGKDRKVAEKSGERQKGDMKIMEGRLRKEASREKQGVEEGAWSEVGEQGPGTARARDHPPNLAGTPQEEK